MPPTVEAQSLNHWTTREVPVLTFKKQVSNNTAGYLCKIQNQKTQNWEFRDSPVITTLSFHCRGHRLDPWSGNKDPVMPCGTAKKQTNKYFLKKIKLRTMYFYVYTTKFKEKGMKGCAPT